MCNSKIEYRTKTREETFDVGKRLAERVNPGDVIALYGELGSGKTVFAQGLCKGLDVMDYVTSPSFTLIQEYRGKNLDVFHFDFYRLNSLRAIENLGIFYYFERGGISIIEWPEIAEEILPAGTIKVRFERVIRDNVLIENERLISVEFCRVAEDNS